MATTTPISPHEQADNHNHNHQPPITASPPPPFVPSPIEYADQHHQFTGSISPSPPPENSADLYQFPPPEDVEDQQEPPVPPPSPPEEKFYHQQPLPPTSPPPPPTGTEQPPENFIQNHEYPIPTQQPSPSPPTDPVESPNYPVKPEPTSEHELPVESPNYPIKPELTSPLSKQPDPVESHPNLCESPNSNPNLDHQSPSPSSPAKSLIQANPSPNPNQSPKHRSPSPPPTTGSPSSPPSPQDTLEAITTVTPPLGIPLLPALASSSPVKPQISPWTHQETVNLIQAYQEKWYSLKKGPLKAGQWEEVAITVAARCGYDEPTKTSKQCRHKLEKLRKRYRAERGKPRSKANAWNFFKLMDNLEKGPLPISSSQSMALVEYQKPSSSNGKKRKIVYREDDDDDDDDDNDNDENNDDGDDEYLVNKRSSRSKKYSHHVPNGYLARNLRYSDSGSRVVRGLRTPVVHKRKEFVQKEEEEEEEEGGDIGCGAEGVATQLAVEIKGFAEKFVKMENKKIEMIRDVERYRLEMENKRIEMILESQQMLVETVNKAFSSFLKTNKLSAN